jgi:hypothetical protein
MRSAPQPTPSHLGVVAHRGRPHHLWSDGTLLPVVSGGDGPGGATTGGPGDGGGGTATGGTGGQGGGAATGTGTGAASQGGGAAAGVPDLGALQAALDQAKASGTTEASQALLGALGFDRVEDAQAWVKAKRDEEAASLTEMERRERDAEERERRAAEREAAAATAARTSAVKDALRDAGAPREHVADLVALVAVDGEADEAGITAAVEAVKAKFPALFGVPGTAPSSNPSGQPAAQGTKSGLEAGREQARLRMAESANDPAKNPFAPFQRATAS